ncbi:hypothetical protein ENBRE01_1863 [Enteropsectra breve]|nr:hypothetical protein ENBRE01_1538 [Enteropsectra breve]KAI5151044.1 hypothetical protein ENBRE01_1863 [Enteropsectra breve]
MQQEQEQLPLLLSTIAYLRNFFDEDSFDAAQSDMLTLRILRKNERTVKFMDWLDILASHKDEISGVMLGIYSQQGLEEIYELRDIFADTTNKEDIPECPVIEKIKNLCKILQKLDPLPSSKIKIKLKIMTKHKIEIPGFKSLNERWKVAQGIELESNGVFIKKKLNEREKDNLIKYKYKIDYSKEMFDSRELSFYNSPLINKKYPIKVDTQCNNSTDNKQNVTDITKEDTNNKAVKCPCCINNQDGQLIKCSNCNFYQHAVCMGYFSSRDNRIPIDYICLFCGKENNMIKRKICVFRRILYIVYNEDFRTKDYIRRRLGLTNNFVEIAFKRLIEEGFIESKYAVNNDKNRQLAEDVCIYVAVKSQESKIKIKKYYNANKEDVYTSMESIEVSG